MKAVSSIHRQASGSRGRKGEQVGNGGGSSNQDDGGGGIMLYDMRRRK